MSERPPQFPDGQFAIRKKDAPDHYLSEKAGLDEPSFNLTTSDWSIAVYRSPEMARAAWRTFFNMADGEVVRWSPESIEVVTG